MDDKAHRSPSDTPSSLVLATRNAGKVAEMRDLLEDLPVRLIAAGDVEGAPEVEEDAATLAGNARKKAKALYECTGFPALADDTGLEVRALGGAPGVYSARYAGPACDATANRTKLLEELADEEDLQAQFRTVVAFVAGEEVHYFEGICSGSITREERGSEGFGYDAIFQPDGFGQTFAELPADEKNRISHRGRALEKVKLFMRETW